MPRQMSGKVCIVTGASSGLGEAIAKMLASRGASVVLCGRDTGRLKTVLDQCIKVSGNHSKRFLALSGDVTKSNIRTAIVDKTIRKFGRLDVLVTSAGIYFQDCNLLTCTEESFDAMININVKAVAFLIREVVPYLEKTKGNIVNISSIGGSLASTKDSLYAMSKAALDHMTRCFVLGLGKKGIRINAVSPSFTPTRILRDLGDQCDEASQHFAKVDGPRCPLHGRTVTKEEIAETVTFLASDAASFITGEVVNVDGGRHLNGPIMVGQ